MILDLYGFVIKIQCNPQSLLKEITRPFKFFVSEEKPPGVTINIEQRDPPYRSFPSIKASFSTPRNIVYKNNNQKIIDYFGKGVVLEEDSKFYIYGCDDNFLCESFYLLIISLFGQFCDKVGYLRVHALALSYKDTAILLPIPPGGGKSTLAMGEDD